MNKFIYFFIIVEEIGIRNNEYYYKLSLIDVANDV